MRWGAERERERKKEKVSMYVKLEQSLEHCTNSINALVVIIILRHRISFIYSFIH